MADDEDIQAKKAAWEARLKAGPILELRIEEPLELTSTPDGAVHLTFVWGSLAGLETASTARVILTPDVARRLKATLPLIPNIPDGFAGPKKQPH